MRSIRILLSALTLLLGAHEGRAVVIDSFTQDTPFLTTGVNEDAGGVLLSRRAGVLGGIVSGGLTANEELNVVDKAGGVAAEISWPSPADSIPDTDYTNGGTATDIGLVMTSALGDWSATVSATDGVNSDSVTVTGLTGGPALVLFPMADFTGVDFASIDSLRLLLTDATAPGDNFNAAVIATGTVVELQNLVPEPGSAALFGLGLLGLGWMGRRRPC